MGDEWKQQKAWQAGKGDDDLAKAMRASMVESGGSTGQSLAASGDVAIDPMVKSLMEMGFQRGECWHHPNQSHSSIYSHSAPLLSQPNPRKLSASPTTVVSSLPWRYN